MKIILTLALREWEKELGSKKSMLVLSAFLFVLGIFYHHALFINGLIAYDAFFNLAPLALLLLVPLLGAKTFIDEKRTGVFKQLASLPISSIQLIIGKYLGALSIAASLLFYTLPFMGFLVYISPADTPLDLAPIALGYAGLFLLCCALCALGIWVGTVFQHSAPAFLLTLLMGMILFFIQELSVFFPASYASFLQLISLDEHLKILCKGILDTRSITFFISFSLFFILFAWLRLGAQKIHVSLLFSVPLVLPILSQQVGWKYDVTLQKKYTLSPITSKALEDLKQPLQISLYFSKDLPYPYTTYERYLKDLLQEYKNKNPKYIQIEWNEPNKEEMKELGIKPIQVDVLESGEEKTKTIYMALVLFYNDQKRVLDHFNPLELLQSQLSLKILQLSKTQKPTLSYKQNLPWASFQTFQNLLENHYTLASSENSSDTLLLMGSPEVDIKEFKKYKNIIALLDLHRFDPITYFYKETFSLSKEMDSWLKTFGIHRLSGLILDRHSAPIQNRLEQEEIAIQTEQLYPLFIVSEYQNNPILLPFVSAFEVKQKPHIIQKVLISSSRQSWVDDNLIQMTPDQEWTFEQVLPQGPFPLGVLLRNTKTDSSLLFMSSSAFLWDEFIQPPQANFILDWIDWLQNGFNQTQSSFLAQSTPHLPYFKHPLGTQLFMSLWPVFILLVTYSLSYALRKRRNRFESGHP